MDAIKDVLTDLMQDLKTRKPSKDAPEFLLKKILSIKESGHVNFRYFRKGVLGITVDSSVRIYQMNLQKQELLTKLRKKSAAVEDLRFYIGETE